MSDLGYNKHCKLRKLTIHVVNIFIFLPSGQGKRGNKIVEAGKLL